MLDDHLKHCVMDAAAEGGSVAEAKLKDSSDAIARRVRSVLAPPIHYPPTLSNCHTTALKEEAVMSVFAIRDYRQLFSAQVIALFGTGLATVALGLLAYDLAGRNAGAVLATALTIKMVMYVVIAALAAAYVDRLPRKTFLATLDAVRAAVVLALPFITEVWHIYVLIAVLQSASAAFTPTFQAVIPDIVTEESDYTVMCTSCPGGARATSRSRCGYGEPRTLMDLP